MAKPNVKSNRSKGSNSRSKSWQGKESRDMKRDYKKKTRNNRSSSDEDELRSTTNDPGWYAKDEAVLRDAASYPFSYPVGRPIHMISTGGRRADYLVPGLMSFRLMPTIGFADNPTSPVNTAANAVYSWIRHANSGSRNYDSTDLMIYILAMANVYSALNWAQRLYGYATLYDQKNRYMPAALIQANGVDPDSMINNLASYRYRLNVLINKVAAMAVPNTFTLFNRIAFLYQNVFIEGNSIKDQLYQYVPEAFYKFELDANTAGSLVLEYVGNPNTLQSWSQVLDTIETLIGAVWAEEDFGIMSGDILKAYGDNIIKIASLPEFYPVVPIYDEMVLTQMKNILPVALSPQSNEVHQSQLGEYLVSQPTFSNNSFGQGTSALGLILSINYPDPTPGIIMEATRLAPCVESGGAVKSGSEVCTDIYVTVLSATTGVPITDNLFDFPGCINMGNPDPLLPLPGVRISRLRAFKYCPRYWFFEYTDQQTGEDVMEQVFEVDNYTYLDPYNLEKLHEAAWLNMLSVPSVGKA